MQFRYVIPVLIIPVSLMGQLWLCKVKMRPKMWLASVMRRGRLVFRSIMMRANSGDTYIMNVTAATNCKNCQHIQKLKTSAFFGHPIDRDLAYWRSVSFQTQNQNCWMVTFSFSTATQRLGLQRFDCCFKSWHRRIDQGFTRTHQGR